MSYVTRLFNRLLPALVIGLGVMLLSAGLLNFAPAGLQGPSAPSADPQLVADDPLFSAPPDVVDEPTFEPDATPAPGAPGTPADPSATPDPGATPEPGATDEPEGTPEPGGTPADPNASPAAPEPTPEEPEPVAWPVLPTPTPAPGAAPQPGDPAAVLARGYASRIRISSLRINLPVVSGDLKVRGNRGGYPLCDVAQYLTYFVQPGEPGSTYIYAHAQRGMFLPILRASRINDGASMIGALVEVWTTQNKRFVYKIYKVKRHATNLNLAINVPAGVHRLVLQTSEGPSGTRGKLQVAAKLISVSSATFAASQPTPHPRVCLPP